MKVNRKKFWDPLCFCEYYISPQNFYKFQEVKGINILRGLYINEWIGSIS